jgi:helix-turn-helix protein
VGNTALQSQRAQTQSRAAREPVNLGERLAFSPKEFAAALGKSPTYAYRQIYAGRIKPISDAGRLLIPRVEVDAFWQELPTTTQLPNRRLKRNKEGNNVWPTTRIGDPMKKSPIQVPDRCLGAVELRGDVNDRRDE